jgi:hypothetical protein
LLPLNEPDDTDGCPDIVAGTWGFAMRHLTTRLDQSDVSARLLERVQEKLFLQLVRENTVPPFGDVVCLAFPQFFATSRVDRSPWSAAMLDQMRGVLKGWRADVVERPEELVELDGKSEPAAALLDRALWHPWFASLAHVEHETRYIGYCEGSVLEAVESLLQASNHLVVVDAPAWARKASQTSSSVISHALIAASLIVGRTVDGVLRSHRSPNHDLLLGHTLSLAAWHARGERVSGLAVQRLRQSDAWDDLKEGMRCADLTPAVVEALTYHTSLLFVAMFALCLTETEFKPHLEFAAARILEGKSGA